MKKSFSPPALFLRLEGAATFAASAGVYAQLDRSWWWFALWFFVPDLSMAGYAAGARVGAWAYNLAHTTAVPVVVGLAGWSLAPDLVPLALVWVAHIGFDRMLGFGLKYPTAFRETHLGRV